MSTIRVLAGLGLVALLATACGGERKRPGPPTLTLEAPPGNVVTSPDTFAVGLHASDDNGLDSIIVSFLSDVRGIDVFEKVDYTDYVIFAVPAGHVVGEVLQIVGVARDLNGERASTSISVTVVDTGGVQR
jgi:hypothetical protein